MKTKYTKPTIALKAISVPAFALQASLDGETVSEASPTDGPTVEDPSADVGEAWGDAKLWGWDFND